MNVTAAGECRASESASEQRWADVVERIRQGDPSGTEDLYQVFSKGVRFFLYRPLGPRDLDDKVHDVFGIVAQFIRRGDLRDPERLMGCARTVVRRQVVGHIEDAVQERRYYVDLDGTLVLADHHPTRSAMPSKMKTNWWPGRF